MFTIGFWPMQSHGSRDYSCICWCLGGVRPARGLLCFPIIHIYEFVLCCSICLVVHVHESPLVCITLPALKKNSSRNEQSRISKVVTNNVKKISMQIYCMKMWEITLRFALAVCTNPDINKRKSLKALTLI
jgi:hypothetical protein